MATVLVVEDELLIRDYIADELAQVGFTVIEASNADEAIVILETCREIHLVFTDIDMPGSMDGLKLAEAVRDRWPPVEILVTSGKHTPEKLPDRALFIAKPYRAPHLISTMNGQLKA